MSVPADSSLDLAKALRRAEEAREARLGGPREIYDLVVGGPDPEANKVAAAEYLSALTVADRGYTQEVARALDRMVTLDSMATQRGERG